MITVAPESAHVAWSTTSTDSSVISAPMPGGRSSFRYWNARHFCACNCSTLNIMPAFQCAQEKQNGDCALCRQCDTGDHNPLDLQRRCLSDTRYPSGYSVKRLEPAKTTTALETGIGTHSSFAGSCHRVARSVGHYTLAASSGPGSSSRCCNNSLGYCPSSKRSTCKGSGNLHIGDNRCLGQGADSRFNRQSVRQHAC